PAVVGREKSKLPNHATRPELDPDLTHAELAGDDVHHLVRGIAFAKEHLLVAILPSCHERLKPIHREIAISRGVRLAHELDHLMEPDDVDRQEQDIKNESRD